MSVELVVSVGHPVPEAAVGSVMDSVAVSSTNVVWSLRGGSR